ncbi:MAG: hypothetical protein BGO41_03275 [Clostridiales bacterium 38-18]|nr:MAG: hypothetical protein BGO41_03275 [Clostridiales bacterium 38-18]
MQNQNNSPLEALIKNLESSTVTGLTDEQAIKKRETFGYNRLEAGKRRTLVNMILDQFKDFTVIILMIAAVISIFLKEMIDGIVILGIVVLNAGLGAYQENKASNALDALKKMASPKTKVIRGGKLIEIDSPELVPGDLVKLDTGDFVPADLRLVESVNLKIDESALTGESVPVEKDYLSNVDENAPLGDQTNAAFSGTIVTYGYGKGIVVKTGMSTQIGQIAKMLNETEDEMTPLQKKLAQFGKMLGIACLTVSTLIIVLGIIRKEPLLEVFLTAVSLAVAAIPEGLPAVVTTVLALGMQRMVSKHAIMKRLSAVETLGSTTVICTDKTGTLTQNKMTVQALYESLNPYEVTGTGYSYEGEIKHVIARQSTRANSENKQTHDMHETHVVHETHVAREPHEQHEHRSSAKWLYLTAALCNDAEIEGESCIGDPTEGALLVLAHKGGVDYKTVRKAYPRLDEFPFDSDRKLMSTVHEIDSKRVLLTKGAPDELLSRATKIWKNGQSFDLTKEDREQILSQNKGYAKDALRVIGYAMKEISENDKAINSERGLTFLGLSGMIDPPREEAIKAIKICKNAGIRVVMITGDHITTASAIAMRMGIIDSEMAGIEGSAINGMSETELIELLKAKNVFARVSPEHKVRIVKALKSDRQVVAMTGDGVNDAPALKSADIGVAMGITGTDVSKEAADMILTDDNFASIVSAVEEGRIIYSNIRKFVGFLLSCNIGEILIIFIAMVFNWGIPLVPIQLLWVNLITDSLPAFALGLEKGEATIMNHRPRDIDEPIIDRKMAYAIGFQSIGLTIAVLAAYQIGLSIEGATIELARTYAFSTLILGEMFRAYSARREDKGVWQFNPFSNKLLNLSVVIALILLFAVIYIPALQVIFSTVPLSFGEVDLILLLSLLPLVFGELSKIAQKVFIKN